MNRLLAVSLLIAACLTFAGCGEDSGKDEIPGPAEVIGKSVAEQDGDPKTLYMLSVRHCEDEEAMVTQDLVSCDDIDVRVPKKTYDTASVGDRFNLKTRKVTEKFDDRYK
jgi:hypothetical protein